MQEFAIREKFLIELDERLTISRNHGSQQPRNRLPAGHRLGDLTRQARDQAQFAHVEEGVQDRRDEMLRADRRRRGFAADPIAALLAARCPNVRYGSDALE